MNKSHNKEGPDCDVGYAVFRLSRDGTEKSARDGTEKKARNGTERMARDGTGERISQKINRKPADKRKRLTIESIARKSRDGTERLARDKIGKMPGYGIVRLARDGIRRLAGAETNRKSRDGTLAIPIDVSTLYSENTWINCHQPIIKKPPGKGFFNRGNNFRRRNEIGGKPPLGCGEAELCPDVIESKNDKFSKFAALGFENLIMNTTC